MAANSSPRPGVEVGKASESSEASKQDDSDSATWVHSSEEKKSMDRPSTKSGKGKRIRQVMPTDRSSSTRAQQGESSSRGRPKMNSAQKMELCYCTGLSIVLCCILSFLLFVIAKEELFSSGDKSRLHRIPLTQQRVPRIKPLNRECQMNSLFFMSQPKKTARAAPSSSSRAEMIRMDFQDVSPD